MSSDRDDVHVRSPLPRYQHGPPTGERPRSRLRVGCREEAGFTLVEVLIAAVLGIVVTGAAADFIVVSLNQSNAASSRTVAARQAEVLLARLTREVREAQNVREPSTGANTTPVNVTYAAEGSSSSISFYLPNPGSTAKGTQVTWTCTAGSACTRSAGAGPSVIELKGVQAATFTPYGSTGATLASGAGVASPPQYPSSIQMTLSVLETSQQDSSQSQVVAGTSAITVQDGVTLRNYLS